MLQAVLNTVKATPLPPKLCVQIVGNGMGQQFFIPRGTTNQS